MIAVTATEAVAEIAKCTDANGRVTYQDSVCPNASKAAEVDAPGKLRKPDESRATPKVDNAPVRPTPKELAPTPQNQLEQVVAPPIPTKKLSYEGLMRNLSGSFSKVS